MVEKSLWEQEERVENFAARATDQRLVELLKIYENPKEVKLLDLGCAGGRNTLYMIEQGFNVWAVDSSLPMVEKTKRVIKTGKEISAQILHGKMDDLGWCSDEYFDLIVALGIYHNAQSEGEFFRALKESHRVLKTGALVLVANFAPGTNFGEFELTQDKATNYMWRDKQHGNLCLLTAEELDREMKRLGFSPHQKTATVTKKLEKGIRITVNALYSKK